MAAAEEMRAHLAGLALRGSLATLIARGAGEVLRLGSNLLLTRLVFPEAFGLMALAHSIALGARMFSDLGIRGSIVQHSRGDDQAFLDTAWTLQILRGAAVFAVLWLASSWAAAYYEQPSLAGLIRAVSFTALIEGFTSTAVFTLARRVRPARVIARELVGQAIGVLVMLAWAWASHSIWALAAGPIAASFTNMATSHWLVPGYRNRPRYERAAAREIGSFGRWIFLATAMTFLLGNAESLALGKLVPAGELGVYRIALVWALAVPGIVQGISGNVLFSVFARLRSLALGEQRSEVARYRRLILGVAVPPLWALVAFGPELVGLLYDDRYEQAGWMVQLLSIGMIGVVLSHSTERVLLASGDSFRHMLLQCGQALLLLAGMWAGALAIGGVRGVLLGTAAARLAAYLPLAILLRPTGLWLPGLDLGVLGSTALLAAAVALVRGIG